MGNTRDTHQLIATLATFHILEKGNKDIISILQDFIIFVRLYFKKTIDFRINLKSHINNYKQKIQQQNKKQIDYWIRYFKGYL